MDVYSVSKLFSDIGWGIGVGHCALNHSQWHLYNMTYKSGPSLCDTGLENKIDASLPIAFMYLIVYLVTDSVH